MADRHNKRDDEMIMIRTHAVGSISSTVHSGTVSLISRSLWMHIKRNGLDLMQCVDSSSSDLTQFVDVY